MVAFALCIATGTPGARGASEGSDTQHAAPARRCPPAGARVVARSPKVVAYEPPFAEDDGTGSLRACKRATHRRRTIDVDARQAVVAVRGTVVGAYGTRCIDSDGLETCPLVLLVRDLTTGRQTTLGGAPACAAIEPRPGYGLDRLTCGPIVRLVVGTKRTAAWSARLDLRSIVAMSSRGQARIVAQGPGIDLRSMRTTTDGRGFTWTRDGSVLRARWP
jgi:hypothetical protein